MLYPISLVNVQDDLLLHIPVQEKVKATYENLLANNSDTVFPYWAKIWASSKAMAAFLKAEPHLVTQKNVIEIGAGIGLPSFTIAKYTKEIIVSDYADEAVKLIQLNSEYLQLNQVKAMRINWNNYPDNLFADTVLLSDINYEPDQFNALMQLIQFILTKGSTVIIATPHRVSATPFVLAIKPFTKRVVEQTVEENNQSIMISIFVL